MTELNGSGAWKHSNVFVGGRLLATYEGPSGTATLGYHFHLTDWLGTKRMQTTASGNQEEVCTSYPFGDGLSCSGPSADATEQHFTGKERDAESGLDYFFARYYSSDLARFMTPDWAAAPTAVPYATFGDPQTLNLYAYVNNNPNTGIDADGHITMPGMGGGSGTSGGFENDLGPNGEGAESFEIPLDQGGSSQSSDSTGSSGNSGKDDGSTDKKSAPQAQKPAVKDPEQSQSQPGQNATAVAKGLTAGASAGLGAATTPAAAATKTATAAANSDCAKQASAQAKPDYDKAKATLPSARNFVGVVGTAAIAGWKAGKAWGAVWAGGLTAAGLFFEPASYFVQGGATETMTLEECTGGTQAIPVQQYGNQW